MKRSILVESLQADGRLEGADVGADIVRAVLIGLKQLEAKSRHENIGLTEVSRLLGDPLKNPASDTFNRLSFLAHVAVLSTSMACNMVESSVVGWESSQVRL